MGVTRGRQVGEANVFPPALRLAKPRPVDAFVDGLAPLKSTLDRKAKEAGADDGTRGEDE